MRDGGTRRLRTGGKPSRVDEFLAELRATLVIVRGQGAEGVEYVLESERILLGRGPGVDLEFADTAMSRQHAAIEFLGDGFSIRDLGSTNGVLVNGSPASAAHLKHGDRLQLGEHVFQYVLEERGRPPRVYSISE